MARNKRKLETLSTRAVAGDRPVMTRTKDKKAKPEQLDSIDFPRRLTIDEFLTSLPEHNPQCLSEKPKQLAKTVKLATELVFALRDLGIIQCRLESQKMIFKNKNMFLEFKMHVWEPNSNECSQFVYEAHAGKRSDTREACCALVLAHYFGEAFLARELLENYMKNSPYRVILYDKPGSGWAKAFEKVPNELKNLAAMLSCHPCYRKITPDKALGGISFMHKRHRDLPQEIGQIEDKFLICNSPLQAFKVRKGTGFSFEDFVFIPVFTLPNYDQLFGCLVRNDQDEETIIFPYISTSLYVAVQICCAKYLAEKRVDKRVRDSVALKFERIYRKDYQSYSYLNFTSPLPKKQIYDLVKAVQPRLLSEIIGEDEHFELVVKEKTIIRERLSNTDECDNLAVRVKLLTSFLGHHTLPAFNLQVQSPLGGQVLSGKRRSKTVGSFSDYPRFQDMFHNNNVQAWTDFLEGFFIVCLHIGDCGQFTVKSEDSLEDALTKVMQKAVHLHQGAIMDRQTKFFADCDLCDLVNMVAERLQVELWQLTECIVPQKNNAGFLASLSVNDRTWHSKVCQSEAIALRELLISVCSTT